jgi:predicted kinase
MYGTELTARTYMRLAQQARSVACAGMPAVIDATFLRREQRAMFRDLARELDVPFVIVSAHAPHAVLRTRIEARLAQGKDASEATPAVLEAQTAMQEPLDSAERAAAIEIGAAGDLAADAKKVTEALLRRLAP